MRDTEVTIYDRPSMSLVRTTRVGVGHLYLLRVGHGASKSLVNAALRALTDAAPSCGQRVIADVTEYEFEDRFGAFAFAA